MATRIHCSLSSTPPPDPGSRPSADGEHPERSQPPGDVLDAGFRYALSLTHHVQDAEDLVQEAWVRLCRSRGEVRHRSPLFKTIRNLFIDQCRRRGKVGFDCVGDAVDDIAAPAATGDAGARHDLEHWLGRLRPAEREAVYLHYAEGWTAREIARLTGRPRNTVLSLLHRARARLLQAAGADEPPGDEGRCEGQEGSAI